MGNKISKTVKSSSEAVIVTITPEGVYYNHIKDNTSFPIGPDDAYRLGKEGINFSLTMIANGADTTKNGCLSLESGYFSVREE